MKKSLAATAIAATAIGGAAAGATLFTPVIAGAQDSTEIAADPTASNRLSNALQGLVDDGTINESQRDAVVATLQEARAERDGLKHRGQRGRSMAGAGVIAETLGLDGPELRNALQSGQSLADIAADQGISTDDLVDAIVDQVEERVSGALERGRIDEEKAAELLAGAEERAEAIVSGEFKPSERGLGRRGPGPRGADA
jgi:hypothetical protein